jgi:hypothetical protein
MNSKIFLYSSMFLLIFIIGFSIYLRSYLRTVKSLQINSYQCSSECKLDGFSCARWNEVDQKCYPGYCNKGVCQELIEYNKIELWQISIGIASIILFTYVSTAYYFSN